MTGAGDGGRARAMAVRPAPARRSKGPRAATPGLGRLLVVGASFAGALALTGLLAVLLLPFDWSAMLPPQNDPASDRAYLAAVSQKYSRRVDAAGLQRVQLSRDQGAAQTAKPQATTATASGRSAAQNETAGVASTARPSLVSELLKEPLFLASLILSLAPLLGAVLVAVMPRLQLRRESAKESEAVEQEEEAEPKEPGELTAIQANEAETPPEAKTEEEAPAPEAAEEEQDQPQVKPEEEEEEDEEEQAPADLKDLANIFEEEDVSLIALEALAKPLADLEVTQLLDQTAGTARLLENVTGWHGAGENAPAWPEGSA